MGIVITILLVLLAVVVIVRAVSRGKEQYRGHNRCAYCRTHLHRSQDGTAFVATCHKCGRDQPWKVAS